MLLGARGFMFGRFQLRIFAGNANIATRLLVCCYSLQETFTIGLCGDLT